MNIMGERIFLRAIEEKDNVMLLNMINDPEIEGMTGGWSFPISLKNQTEWFNSIKNGKKELRCIIEIKNEEIAIGVVMLTDIDYKNGNAEIHIKLDNKFCGKGYGTEVIRTIVKYAFNELRLYCIYSRIKSDNLISRNMFIKCKFKEEGILVGRLYKDGNYKDILSMSILNKLVK